MGRFALLIIATAIAGNVGFAQNALDSIHISEAQVKISRNLCLQALQPLKYVSDAGKITPRYLLTAGRANDCAGERQKAIDCFEKYLVLVPGNDTVARRLAALKSGGGGSKVVAEEQDAKDLYRRARKGFERPVVSESEFIWGFSGDFAAGGADAPYGWAVNLFNIRQYPFANNKMLFETISSIGYVDGGRHSWFADVLDTTPDDILKVPGTVQGDMQLGLSFLPVNSDKQAMAVGGTIGYHAMLLNGVDVLSGSNTYSTIFLASPIAAANVAWHVGRHFYAGVSYLHFFRSSYANEMQYTTKITPVNECRIRISIGTLGYW